MKLNIEKGFTINKEEAEVNTRQQNAATAETTVSAALSLNQPSLLGINLDQINVSP